jgi:hypothetical protein
MAVRRRRILIAQVHDLLIDALVESKKSELAARFVHLLRDAPAPIVQPTVQLADFLLIVDSLQRRSGDRPVKRACGCNAVRYPKKLAKRNNAMPAPTGPSPGTGVSSTAASAPSVEPIVR